MVKKKHIKIIVNYVIGVLLLLSIALNALQILVILPTYNGFYTIERYRYGIEIGSYEHEKKYNVVIDDYWDAFFVGRKEISERFPEGVFAHARFDFKEQLENRCEIFYDIHSDTWLVYAYTETLNNSFCMEGGAYACIISTNGTIVACWGEP